MTPDIHKAECKYDLHLEISYQPVLTHCVLDTWLWQGITGKLKRKRAEHHNEFSTNFISAWMLLSAMEGGKSLREKTSYRINKTKNKRRLKVVNFRLLSMYLSLHVPTLWLADTNCPPQRNHVERNQMTPASTFYYSLKKLSWIPWSFLFPSTQKFLREELTFYMIFTHLCSRWFLRKHPKYSPCLLKYYAYHVLLWDFFGHIHCKNIGTGR